MTTGWNVMDTSRPCFMLKWLRRFTAQTTYFFQVCSLTLLLTLTKLSPCRYMLARDTAQIISYVCLEAKISAQSFPLVPTGGILWLTHTLSCARSLCSWLWHRCQWDETEREERPTESSCSTTHRHQRLWKRQLRRRQTLLQGSRCRPSTNLKYFEIVWRCCG